MHLFHKDNYEDIHTPILSYTPIYIHIFKLHMNWGEGLDSKATARPPKTRDDRRLNTQEIMKILLHQARTYSGVSERCEWIYFRNQKMLWKSHRRFNTVGTSEKYEKSMPLRIKS